MHSYLTKLPALTLEVGTVLFRGGANGCNQLHWKGGSTPLQPRSQHLLHGKCPPAPHHRSTGRGSSEQGETLSSGCAAPGTSCRGLLSLYRRGQQRPAHPLFVLGEMKKYTEIAKFEFMANQSLNTNQRQPSSRDKVYLISSVSKDFLY